MARCPQCGRSPRGPRPVSLILGGTTDRLNKAAELLTHTRVIAAENRDGMQEQMTLAGFESQGDTTSGLLRIQKNMEEKTGFLKAINPVTYYRSLQHYGMAQKVHREAVYYSESCLVMQTYGLGTSEHVKEPSPVQRVHLPLPPALLQDPERRDNALAKWHDLVKSLMTPQEIEEWEGAMGYADMSLYLQSRNSSTSTIGAPPRPGLQPDIVS